MRYVFATYTKRLFASVDASAEAMSCFAVSTARECTFVHDRRGAAARREIDRYSPPPVRFFHNI